MITQDGSERGRVDITVAREEEIPAVQGLWRKYWSSLGLAADFQGFADEVQTLPGMYALPKGKLLLARLDGTVAGTVAIRPLEEECCEVKRLYVQPEFRGHGVGKALLVEAIKQARSAGYKELYGDTLPSMDRALRMYREMGFSEVAAYSAQPTPGAVFLKLVLS